jgi:putative ABC transport system permease protein
LVACFALGVGAHSAVFAIVNATLIRALPFREPERLVTIWNQFPTRGLLREPLSELELLDCRQSAALESASGLLNWRFNLTGVPEPEQLVGAKVSASLFPLLGVEAVAGRTFSADEETPGHDRVVLLSHRLWQRRFAGEPGIVGQTLTLNNEPHVVVGVLPRDFRFGDDALEVWAPLAIGSEKPLPRDARAVITVGRLRDGVSMERAQANMDLLASRLRRDYPNIYPAGSGYGIRLTRLQDDLVGEARPALLSLFAAGGLVLLTACSNVVNLTLARATERSRELVIRSALGAGRGALIRPFIAESTSLTLAGGATGLLFAYWVVGALVALAPEGIPRLQEIAVDRAVFGVALTFSLISGLSLGTLATVWALRHGGSESLKDGGEKAATGRRGQRTRGTLVVVQVALAVLVLVGAGLLTRSFLRLRQVDLGFRPDHLLTFQIFLPRAGYKEPARTIGFFDGLLGEITVLPGVRAAAAVSDLPFSDSDLSGQVAAEGAPLPRPGDLNSEVSWRVATAGYFETLGIRLEKGRLFRASDAVAAPAVVVVDSRLARRLWPGQEPLGRRLSLRDWANTDWLTVVGVVGPVKQNSLTADSPEQLYLPQAQNARRMMSVVVRTQGDPMQTAGTIRRLVWRRAPDLPVVNLRPMEELVSATTSRLEFNLWLFGTFSLLSVGLAVLGLYSLTSYSVAQRTREFAIRIAIGARRRDILRLVLKQSARNLLLGLALGLLLALWLGHVLRSQLYEVLPNDPFTLCAALLLICGLGVLASYVPARRATRIDPLQALGRK